MADVPGPSNLVLQENVENKENMESILEPEKKKARLETPFADKDKLEDRLSGILCCAVCLDLPRMCFQVATRIYSKIICSDTSNITKYNEFPNYCIYLFMLS